MRPLVILRPEPGAGRTAERAVRLGLAPRLHPLFAPCAVDWAAPPPDPFDALLMTSAHAARLAGPALATYLALPAYAVGSATAQAMTERGFTDVITGDGDGSAIAARIAADGHRHVLHLGGTTVAPIAAGPLMIDRIAVYAMMGTDPVALDVPPGSVVLVHSPLAGQRLAEQIAIPLRNALHIVAISPAALAACGAGWASAQAAERPADDDMLALARRLCE
ncbi:MAG: uroporphyrinogen-III synthase [bacterium]|nr:uroporphyrinogen-III synthase [bacterium]